jgi:hypothetical protein
VEPPIASIRIDNQVKAVASKQCTGDVRYNPVTQADGISVTVSGQLGEGCNSQTYLSLLDHPTYTAGAVRAIWNELGGSIQGRIENVPKSARLLARAFSPDLVEVIRDINKYSNNTMAQQLFLSLGAQFRTDADGDDARAAQRVVRQWLAKKGITAPHLVMENGSGLSRAERVSAREMAAMLQAAWNSPYAAEFISSMPLVGMDGTMRKRLKRTAMPVKHIKTGTLNTVRAIAGFSRDSNGNTWAVAAILNDPNRGAPRGAGPGAAGPVSPAEAGCSSWLLVPACTGHFRAPATASRLQSAARGKPPAQPLRPTPSTLSRPACLAAYTPASARNSRHRRPPRPPSRHQTRRHLPTPSTGTLRTPATTPAPAAAPARHRCPGTAP